MKEWRQLALIASMSAILFIPFLGRVHLFDWDEINFAESAREMLMTGNYSIVMIDFQPFYEKPPLFFWLQAAAMKIFGVNEFAARFPNAVCGIITLSLIFFLGRKHFDAVFGRLWTLAYAGSLLPHFYFKSGIIDPWFNLFIFSGIAALAAARDSSVQKLIPFALAGCFTALAILTKGPVALLLVMLTAILYFISSCTLPSFKDVLIFFLFVFFVSSLWYGIEIMRSGMGFVRQFTSYQAQLFGTEVAGHGGPFYYHAVVLLLGCFPASVIAIPAFFSKHGANSLQLDFRKWMLILFLVVLVLFSVVKTKIIHYSSLCYLPLTFFAAWEIYFRMKNTWQFSGIQSALLLLFGLLIGGVAAFIPYLGENKDLLMPHLDDPFAKASLEANVSWHGSLIAIGVTYMALVIASVAVMRRRLQAGTILMFAGTGIFIQALMIFFVPRIEQYTQRAAVDFYKSLQGKDVYVYPLGFKSYAHLFYSQKKPPAQSEYKNTDLLLNSALDKPAYFVSRTDRAQRYRSLPQLEEIGRKNGFVFFKRK
ncbi:MAG TPA: glycosyltransferase family 39 protein [Chitinophagales bacterium]|nr:glycosyltransferase family 39 protein [Chitinophagales bacterium]